MAIIELSNTLASYRGRDGQNTVLYPIGDRTIGRAMVTPIAPITPLRTELNGLLATASTAFSTISDDDRDGWEQLARLVPYLDANGSEYSPTAKGLFVGVNIARGGESLPVDPIAPSPIIMPAVTDIVSIALDAAANRTRVTYTKTQSTGFFSVQFTAPLPTPQRNPRLNDYASMQDTFFRSFFPAIAGSPVTRLFFTTSNNHVINVGDFIGVRITAFSPGFLKGRTFAKKIQVIAFP